MHLGMLPVQPQQEESGTKWWEELEILLALVSCLTLYFKVIIDVTAAALVHSIYSKKIVSFQ